SFRCSNPKAPTLPFPGSGPRPWITAPHSHIELLPHPFMTKVWQGSGSAAIVQHGVVVRPPHVAAFAAGALSPRLRLGRGRRLRGGIRKRDFGLPTTQGGTIWFELGDSQSSSWRRSS